MLKGLIPWIKSTATLIIAPMSIPPEDPRIAQFLNQLLSGERRAKYVDGRRVPLDIFSSRLRALLLSDDPKLRDLVRSPTGFHSSLDMVIHTLPNDDEPPYLKPPNDRNWHHLPITNLLFPKLTKQPAWEEILDETMKNLIKASRSGRIVHFYEHGVQVPPELFDSPFASLLFHPEPEQRARVKNRWGKGSRRKIITISDAKL